MLNFSDYVDYYDKCLFKGLNDGTDKKSSACALDEISSKVKSVETKLGILVQEMLLKGLSPSYQHLDQEKYLYLNKKEKIDFAIIDYTKKIIPLLELKAQRITHNSTSKKGEKQKLLIACDKLRASPEFKNFKILPYCAHWKVDSTPQTDVLKYDERKSYEENLLKFKEDLNSYISKIPLLSKRDVSDLLTGDSNFLNLFLDYLNNEYKFKDKLNSYCNISDIK